MSKLYYSFDCGTIFGTDVVEQVYIYASQANFLTYIDLDTVLDNQVTHARVYSYDNGLTIYRPLPQAA